MTLRLGVLISGRGSNLASILTHINDGHLDASVQLVISNKKNAGGLAIAAAHHIPRRVRRARDFESVWEWETQIAQDLADASVDVVVLAGYMTLIGDPLLSAFGGRIINIHPSLLPRFKGLDAQAQAIAAQATISGCTVHVVTEKMDDGPMLGQAQVPVYPTDSVESLSSRILIEEHRLLPEVLQKIAVGDIQLEGQDQCVR